MLGVGTVEVLGTYAGQSWVAMNCFEGWRRQWEDWNMSVDNVIEAVSLTLGVLLGQMKSLRFQAQARWSPILRLRRRI